jgi:hypothetical protein
MKKLFSTFALTLLLLTQVTFVFAQNDGVANVKTFGAVGNGSTDDTSAIQTAVNYGLAHGQAVYFPCGIYLISTSIQISGTSTWSVFGADESCSIIKTTTNLPMLNIVNDMDMYFPSIHHLSFLGVVTGNRAQLAGIRLYGTTNHHFAYAKIYNLRFLGVTFGFLAEKSSNSGGEALVDWNSFYAIQSTSNGIDPTSYVFYFVNGSGTGNLFHDMNLNFSVAGLYWSGNNGTNIGDIIINNIQTGGSGTGMYFSPNGSYRNQISISNSQFDAGVTTGIYMNGYNHVTLSGLNIEGGNATNQLLNMGLVKCFSFGC